MSDPELSLEREGPAWTLRINRPEKRNAFTFAMWRRFPDLIAEAAAADGARVLVVTGSGGAFAAGADIGEFGQVYADESTASAYTAAISSAFDALASFPKPTIAKIHGACVGGGCGLALACDLRIAAAGSRFGITPAKIGLAYPLAETRRLIDAVGVSFAKEMLFTARIFDADEALAAGLIDTVTPPDALDDAVDRLVAEIAAAAPSTLRATKRIMALIQAGASEETEESRQLFLDAFRSADFQEGYRAYLAKRPARFGGD